MVTLSLPASLAITPEKSEALIYAWVVFNGLPDFSTLQHIADKAGLQFEVVRYWFHCRLNLEGIQYALANTQAQSLHMPALDEYYKLEEFSLALQRDRTRHQTEHHQHHQHTTGQAELYKNQSKRRTKTTRPSPGSRKDTRRASHTPSMAEEVVTLSSDDEQITQTSAGRKKRRLSAAGVSCSSLAQYTEDLENGWLESISTNVSSSGKTKKTEIDQQGADSGAMISSAGINFQKPSKEAESQIVKRKAICLSSSDEETVEELVLEVGQAPLNRVNVPKVGENEKDFPQPRRQQGVNQNLAVVSMERNQFADISDMEKGTNEDAIPQLDYNQETPFDTFNLTIPSNPIPIAESSVITAQRDTDTFANEECIIWTVTNTYDEKISSMLDDTSWRHEFSSIKPMKRPKSTSNSMDGISPDVVIIEGSRPAEDSASTQGTLVVDGLDYTPPPNTIPRISQISFPDFTRKNKHLASKEAYHEQSRGRSRTRRENKTHRSAHYSRGRPQGRSRSRAVPSSYRSHSRMSLHHRDKSIEPDSNLREDRVDQWLSNYTISPDANGFGSMQEHRHGRSRRRASYHEDSFQSYSDDDDTVQSSRERYYFEDSRSRARTSSGRERYSDYKRSSSMKDEVYPDTNEKTKRRRHSTKAHRSHRSRSRHHRVKSDSDEESYTDYYKDRHRDRRSRKSHHRRTDSDSDTDDYDSREHRSRSNRYYRDHSKTREEIEPEIEESSRRRGDYCYPSSHNRANSPDNASSVTRRGRDRAQSRKRNDIPSDGSHTTYLEKHHDERESRKSNRRYSSHDKKSFVGHRPSNTTKDIEQSITNTPVEAPSKVKLIDIQAPSQPQVAPPSMLPNGGKRLFVVSQIVRPT